MALSMATSSRLTATGAARLNTRTFPVSAARLVICRQTVVLLAHQGRAGFLGRLSDSEHNLHFMWDFVQGSGWIVPVELGTEFALNKNADELQLGLQQKYEHTF
ncbi:hypothetical protein FB451DRAFT_1190952 [Mycena latifolia]|nr:hypothetical protein FB451DRAFT_1190952 [Mycena latifolia]